MEVMTMLMRTDPFRELDYVALVAADLYNRVAGQTGRQVAMDRVEAPAGNGYVRASHGHLALVGPEDAGNRQFLLDLVDAHEGDGG